MKKIFMIFILMIFLFCLVGLAVNASAALVTFDDLSQDHQTILGEQYSDLGIHFQNAKAITSWDYDHAPKKSPTDNAGVPYPVNNVSQPTFTFDNVLNSFELLADAYLDGDTKLGSNVLYLEAYGSDGTYLTHSVKTFTNGDWESMTLDLTGWSATKIILHDHGGYFGFDNIRFNFVPIPSSILLFTFGLASLVLIRRKFRE